MDRTLRITIRVRKYLWKDFVYDVCYVLYATIMIANALSKRYLKCSIPALCLRMRVPVVKLGESMDSILKNSVLFFLLISFGIAGLLYTAGIPIILFLAAMGRIQ
ncbi:hypothetical protein HY339_02590 [Candidatus Gottesmanbacteria bacterium]|nr:hypothetical protein [Candidatus Gottesmanbacteria bacterium]